LSFTLYTRDFIAKYSENGRIVDPALEKYVRSTSVGDSSLNLYLRYLGMFLERYGLTPQELYELRLRELRSDDPLEWEVVSGMIKRIMREMEEGNYYGNSLLGIKPWPQSALISFREVRWGKTPKKKEPATCHGVSKSLCSFFEAFGSRFEIKIKSKDKPQGDSQGAKPISLDDLGEVLKHPGDENPHRNVAVALFIKEWGPRCGDIGAFKIAHYVEAKQGVIYNELGEPFIAFDTVRTSKEGILGRPHLGPEAITAIDRYLKVERPTASLEDPLFQQRQKHTMILGPMTGGAVSRMFKNMVNKALGEKGGKLISAHSIRKTYVTLIQSGGMPEKWAKYIQGKANDPYNVPKELQGPSGEEILMESYMKAYDSIRVFREELKLRAQVKKISEEKEEDRQELQYVKMRLNLIETALKLAPQVEEAVDRLEKRLDNQN